jgi:ubiquinone/menaquinone biosynthesis C-methylase UbiE
MKTHFNTPLEEYDTLRTGHQGRRRERLVRDALLARSTCERVAEIGFGTGSVLRNLASEFPATDFWGTEISEEMTRFARTRPGPRNVHFLTGAPDALVEQVGSESFDLVYSLDVIHHVPDQRRLFADVFRLVRPGGWWLAVEPNIWNIYIWFHQEWMRRSGFDEDHFRPWKTDPLLKSIGFHLRSKRSVFLFPAFVRRVPSYLGKFERVVERIPLLGGSVCYHMERPVAESEEHRGVDVEANL